MLSMWACTANVQLLQCQSEMETPMAEPFKLEIFTDYV
jgi:hypothetical protein